MSASQGAWDCKHGVDGRDECEECRAPVTARHDKATEAAAVDQAIAKVRAYLPKPGHRNDHVLESLRVLADAVEEQRERTANLSALLDGINANGGEYVREKFEALIAAHNAAEAESDFLLSDPDNLAIKEWHDRLKAERDRLTAQVESLRRWIKDSQDYKRAERLARQVADLEAALLRTQAIAQRGVGPDTTPEEALETIAAYVEKRLARLVAARSRDPQEPQT